MWMVRVEVPNSDIKSLCRLYCKHCYPQHWVDIREHVDDDINLLFEFDEDNRGNFFWERFKEIRKRFLRRGPLEKIVDIVAMGWDQFQEVFSLLGGNEKQTFVDVEFPNVEWSKEPGIKYGTATLFETEDFFFSIDVMIFENKCFIDDINFGWRSPKFSLKDHLLHLKRFLFNNYTMFLYRYETAINKGQSEKLLSAMKQLKDLIEVSEDGPLVFKTNPPNMPE